ncbi:MAG TPA: metallophosphoesterase [Pyrinomonadaceae bacterium]
MGERTIVVGDIHGCYDEFVELLTKLAPGPADRVIAVGDLIVKGPQSRAVLDLFMSEPRLSAVVGNHDLALVRYWRGETRQLKPTQERARAELEPERARYFAYLAGLPGLIDLGQHVVVHAGVRPGVPLAAQSLADLTELRTLGPDRTSRTGRPWYDVYNGPQKVLFGHWPASPPRAGRFAQGLDTGCVYGYQLTAYVLETEEFVRVQARRAYEPPKQPVA